jgi:hypothetical protein
MNRLIAAAFLASTLMGADIANAVPMTPLVSAQDSDVIRVAGGCGLGMHRGPYGGCRQNYADPGAHACPRGFHIGPGGRCRGDGR